MVQNYDVKKRNYCDNAQRKGKRKEEKGKRKEERGKRYVGLMGQLGLLGALIFRDIALANIKKVVAKCHDL